MIKLVCPRCMNPVPVADDFAGREVTCPSCMKPFDAPARYNPAVLTDPMQPAPLPVAPIQAASGPAASPPPVTNPTPIPTPTSPPEPTMSPETPQPPPGFVPPPPPVTATPQAPYMPASGGMPSAIPDPQLVGYTKAHGITITPTVVAWLPAVLLTLTFLCTFFPWMGSYVGGYPVHSQSPWRAVFGSVSRNYSLEQNMPDPGWIDKVTPDWPLMVPYLLLIFLAAGIAWADRGLHGIDPRKIPPIEKLWKWRKALIALLAALALTLVTVQITRGFGMERAIRTMVRANPELAKAREEAKDSPARLAAVENREDAELAKYNLSRTWWQDIAMTSNLLAVLMVILSIVLDRRGNKPPPKILLHY